jgi:predicted GIY-YIG superfamily endonuclease
MVVPAKAGTQFGFGANEAIQREKRLKKWNRAWNNRPIAETNPEWKDLSELAF